MRYIKVSDENGRVLTVYPISLASMAHSPADTEYFEVASQRAVEDGLATPAEAKKLRMIFVERPSIRTQLQTG